MDSLRNIETILFDYGNTLVSDPFNTILELKAKHFVSLIKAKGFQIGKLKLIKAWSQANGEVQYPHISHFYQETLIIKRMYEILRISYTNSLIEETLKVYRKGFEHILENDRRNFETACILARLKKKKQLGILSNERALSLRLGLQYAHLLPHLKLILSSEEIGVEKPDQNFFLLALQCFNLDSKKTMYVGDDPKQDICPARKIGLMTALYRRSIHESTPWRNYQTRTLAKSDVSIQSISELEKIFDY
jgi:HAD superfamily hydrolase (TIGR01549 family)